MAGHVGGGTRLVATQRGVPLNPAASFPGLAQGAIISATDASGVDGFGGYAFLPEAPGKAKVFWVGYPNVKVHS